VNILFLTQASSLRLFYELMLALREQLEPDKIGFLISDSSYFEEFRHQVPEIESSSYVLLKEWEVMKGVKDGRVDLHALHCLQEELGTPNLWGPLVCDRRVLWGKKFAFRLDYKPRFAHEQVLSILQTSLEAIEGLFNELEPDLVVSFICTRVGEYASYLFARSRNIPFLNLRPTRIGNYMTYGTDVFEPSELVQAAYEKYLCGSGQERWVREAREYLKSVRSSDSRYEGTIRASRKPPPLKRGDKAPLSRRLLRLLKDEVDYRLSGEEVDRHLPGGIVPQIYWRLINPLRAKWVHARLAKEYVAESDLLTLDYAFFPLHTEPEVTLLVYSKEYMNQIEVARNVAYNLPVGMTLVVKEHPASVGKRPLGYYRKLLQILNVRLADPLTDSRPLVANAKIVTTISGSIGLEAVMLGKPVITFGGTPYEILPSQ